MAPSRPDPEEASGADDDGLDYARVRELVGFVLRAARRRRALALTVFGVAVAVTVAAAALWPRTYEASVRILAQRNLIMPAIDNPNRAVPREADDPTQRVAETVFKRDNLVAVIKQANLVDLWDAQRPAILRVKDAALGLFSAPMTDEEKVEAFVGLLEKKLSVQTDENTVTMSVEWTSAATAYQLVSLAEKTFLDARYAAEVSIISDAISILEAHASAEHDEIYAAVDDLQRLRQNRARAAGPMDPAPRGPAPNLRGSAPPPTAPQADASGAEFAQKLEEKRRAIRDLEEARAKRLSDLETKVTELRATLEPAHPSILSLQRQIDAMEVAPPELVQLKNEERDLLAQVVASARERVARPLPDAPSYATSAEPHPAAPPPPPAEDAAVSLAAGRLQTATNRFDDLMSRVDSAHIELDIAKTAFKYRYTLIKPPEVPKHVKRPNVAVLLLGGLALSVFLGLLVAAAKDLASGKFIERWQVERKLRLPILGEVRRP